MFQTHVGPVEDTASVAYLRPETAQGIFVNFMNVATASRRKLPFGIAQVGKSFRNEITPGNFIFRLREFEQMEMEFFVPPADEDTWFAYWVAERLRWWTDVMGINAERLRLRPHDPDELSHYSRQTTDVEYDFPMGWSELEGIADRGSYDLTAHAEASGKTLGVFDEASGEHVVPHVIEPAMGVDRAMLTVLVDGYDEEEVAGEKRVVLRMKPSLAPVKVAVLPLLRNRPELVERAQRLATDLKANVAAVYDDTASIGKLYRRQDEIGTPFCVTVDVESLTDGAATIRERDSHDPGAGLARRHPGPHRRTRRRRLTVVEDPAARLADRPGDDAAHEAAGPRLLALGRARTRPWPRPRTPCASTRTRSATASCWPRSCPPAGAHRDAADEYARLARLDPRLVEWPRAEAAERLAAGDVGAGHRGCATCRAPGRRPMARPS